MGSSILLFGFGWKVTCSSQRKSTASIPSRNSLILGSSGINRANRSDVLLFSFPIITDRLREKLSSETLAERIKKMTASYMKGEN